MRTMCGRTWNISFQTLRAHSSTASFFRWKRIKISRNTLSTRWSPNPRDCEYKNLGSPKIWNSLAHIFLSSSFLLPRLHLEELHNELGNARDLETALGRLPNQLSGVYRRALQRVREQDRDDHPHETSSILIVEMVLCCVRRLTLSELQHGLATREGSVDVDTGVVRSYTKDAILARTAGLISIDDDTVRFMHHTVDDYLEKKDVYEEYFSNGHLTLTKKCLTYVHLTVFDEPTKSLPQLINNYPFLRYAAHFLGHHMSICMRSGAVSANDAREFLEHIKPGASLQVVSGKILTMPTEDRMVPLLHGSSLIHLAILWCIEPFVQALAADPSNMALIQARGFKAQTPLHLAARTGSVTCVKALLEAKADVTATEIQGRTALDLILTRPWRNVILRLQELENLMQLTLVLEEMETYFSEAKKPELKDGHSEDSGPKAHSMTGITLKQRALELFTASKSPKDDIWNGLLNLWDNEQQYAPVAAFIIRFVKLDISDDEAKVAEMLVDAGVDVNSEGVEETTPLQLATLFGREEVVTRLIRRGANPFLTGLLGLNPLEIACIRAATAKEPRNCQVFERIANQIREKIEEVEKLEKRLLNEKERLGAFYSINWNALVSKSLN